MTMSEYGELISVLRSILAVFCIWVDGRAQTGALLRAHAGIIRQKQPIFFAKAGMTRPQTRISGEEHAVYGDL